MIICITGVAGVGKTIIAKKLSEKINAEYIDLFEFARERNLIEMYDDVLKTYIIDEEKVIQEIQRYINKEKDYVIDGNFSHLIPADIYIIIKTDPNILYKRLLERGYSYNKIFENIWAMNLEVIEDELESFGKKYYVFFNNSEEDIERIVNSIINLLYIYKNINF